MPTKAKTTKPKTSKPKSEPKASAKPEFPEGRQPLSDADISKALKKLAGWERNGDTIRKTFKFPAYLSGLAFATTVGTVAEGLDHHPDILVGWRKVTVTFCTHSSGNKITPIDIKAAEAIEALPYKPG